MQTLKVQVITVTSLRQNASLIYDTRTNRGAVVDPGGDIADILAAIEQAGVKVEKILLTHGHFDHAGGAAELAEILKLPIEGPHKADQFLLEKLEETGLSYGVAGMRSVTPDRWLSEGDQVTVGGLNFEVFHCPGHSPGSVIFFNNENRFILMGDVLFKGSVGRTDFPYGNSETLLHAIATKILPLGDDVVFLPGHGPLSQLGVERQNNPHLTGMKLTKP